SQPEQGMQGTQGQRCPNFGMHGLLVFLRPPSGHNGPRDTTFVAGSEKVTFDVKYSGLRPQNPADEFVTGRHSEQRDCGFGKGDRLGSIMKRPLSSKNWRFIGVAACPRVLRSDCGWIILWRGRRRGGVDVVVDHRHCRGCAYDQRQGKCDLGLGRHRRGSYFEMSLSAIEFAQMRREVTCLEFTTTCSTRCHVWTNESLRASNEVA